MEFNEDIVPGYVGDKNIIVTAKLNGREIDHEVSLHLVPFGDAVRTENPVFQSGNFSLEFWLNYHESGTILQQGTGASSFALALDESGHAVVNIAGTQVVSEATLPQDKWTYFVMSYKAETMHLSTYPKTHTPMV